MIRRGKVFRFDDVCIYSDMEMHNRMARFLMNRFQNCQVVFAISPLLFKSEKYKQRIFPKILNAHSDHTRYYQVDDVGLPDVPGAVTKAAHGLFHVDHRLLDKSVQEASIVASCSLSGSRIFVPPFNKWNSDTEEVCKHHGIQLVKFEDGWRCMEYEEWDETHDLWYIHAREFTWDKFVRYFG